MIGLISLNKVIDSLFALEVVFERIVQKID